MEQQTRSRIAAFACIKIGAEGGGVERRVHVWHRAFEALARLRVPLIVVLTGQFGPRLALPPIIVENGPPEGPQPGSRNRLKDGLKSAAMIESRHSPRVRRRPVRRWLGFYGKRSSFSASRRKAPKESAVCSRPPTG
jgi:hypothetical protein